MIYNVSMYQNSSNSIRNDILQSFHKIINLYQKKKNKKTSLSHSKLINSYEKASNSLISNYLIVSQYHLNSISI